jgi:hypothetical protein
MKKPQWITVVGVIGIIIGSFGIIGSINSIIMPHILEFQKDMWSTMQKMPKGDMPEGFYNLFSRMWNIPAWWRTWLTLSGVMSLFTATFFIIASILLLQTKPSSIKLFLWATGLTIAFNFIGTIAALYAGSILALSVLGGYVFGLVVSVILFIVVMTSDKQFFAAPST